MRKLLVVVLVVFLGYWLVQSPESFAGVAQGAAGQRAVGPQRQQHVGGGTGGGGGDRDVVHRVRPGAERSRHRDDAAGRGCPTRR